MARVGASKLQDPLTPWFHLKFWDPSRRGCQLWGVIGEGVLFRGPIGKGCLRTGVPYLGDPCLIPYSRGSRNRKHHFFKPCCKNYTYITELKAPNRVANGVEGRGPERHAHHVGDHQEDTPTHPGLGWQTNLDSAGQ